jgi:hypothetical protein
MSLRNIKKLQSPDLFQHTDDSDEATPRKVANNFELVSEQSYEIVLNFSFSPVLLSWVIKWKTIFVLTIAISN